MNASNGEREAMVRTVDRSLQKLGCREEEERATDRQMETD